MGRTDRPAATARTMPWHKPAKRKSNILPPRPDGEMIWMHASSAERYLALCDLGQRLKTMRPDLSVMMTCEAVLNTMPPPEGCNLVVSELPSEHPVEARRFLDHCKPDLLLWTGGNIRPNLMRAVGEHQVSALLVDVEAHELPTRKRRWLPDQSRKMLNSFTAILSSSDAALVQLRRTGISADKLGQVSRLRISATPPSYHEDELSRVQNSVGSRQVWLAAHACPNELDVILDAHRSALRLLHRLLLVLSVEQYSDLDTAREVLRDRALQFTDWEAGEDLDENAQVLLTCDEDLGLWYRVAPLSLLAGTLGETGNSHNPMDAAALGSAILHGPGIGAHSALYSRLSEAGAAEMVQGKDELALKVIQLSAPDKAAEMAVAGWQVVTEGAELTDHLLERIQDMLDLQEAQHAAT